MQNFGKAVPTAKLNNGVEMPILGFGVFQIEGEKCEQAVLDAIEVGYRLIDTAQAYYNEEFVGKALKKCDVSRSDIFLTTKIWVTEHTYNKAKKSIIESMKKLQTDYLDLVLIHQPLSDYYSAYDCREDLYKEGLIRAIGISNFSSERMVDLSTFNEIKPAINQIETHMFFQQYEANEWMKKYNVQHEAWGPLSQHRINEVMNNPILKEFAEKYKKTPTQIALKSLIQRKIVVIPKTVDKNRMRENIDLFDFELNESEIKRIRSIDENKSMWCEYDNPEIVQMAMS